MSQGEGRSEAAQTSHPGWGAQCLLAAKLRGRLEVWEQRRMVAWDCGVEEEGSGKQLSDSEPRVRTPVVLGGQGSQSGLLLLLYDLGQMPASFWASVYPSLEGHWLPSSLRLCIKSPRRERPKAGPQSPKSHLLLASESHHHPTFTRPGLPLPSFYNLPSPSSYQRNKTKLGGTGAYQGKHTGCRALSHPRSPWTLPTLLGSKEYP